MTTAREPPAVLIRDALLVALTFSSGAIDAISFMVLGKTFSAFMTGNLVFFGMRLVSGHGPALSFVLSSLCAFACGSYLGTSFTTQQGSGLWPWRVSATLLLTATTQLLFFVIWLAAGAQPAETLTTVLLAVSALGMGLQTAAVRSLAVKGIFTTAATFTLVALTGDLVGSRPTDEAPRVASVLAALVTGASVGCFLVLDVAPLYAPILPLLVTLAVVGIGAFRLNRPASNPDIVN
ncbi:YoaK family protein [Methyloceanibacter caenitepidi]|uniref:DUF1275 domain-containing protein n=1 Tax=Methyloceanibacter caenitepidi TaxID=1384459 RepID=A0A0A8K291_9HYPH|nr:YoaK family protein [Methyloceanibacter caenitepidi]BAQ16642.1 protein of unknown function DUF1275 [Methyloceanibacter caenitepidi]